MLESRDLEAMELAKRLFVNRAKHIGSEMSESTMTELLEDSCRFINHGRDFFAEKHCKARK